MTDTNSLTGVTTPEEPQKPVHPEASQRGPDGRFLTGNRLALTHGLRRQNDGEGAGSDLRSEVESFVTESLRDEKAATLSPRRRSLLECRARLHRRIIGLDDALERHGLLDSRGRLRARWLQRLESMINTAKGLDQVLGLEPAPAEGPDLALVLRHHASRAEDAP